MAPIRAVSLCSGIGGFDLAAEMAGMSIVGQVEIDPFCRRVLAKHWPHVKRLSDLWETKGDEFGAIDVLLAGIPCQPFSFAGKQTGTEDFRNLWEPFLSFVKVSRPAWICLENVSGLIRMALDDWLVDLGSLGYATLPLAVPAAAVGAPHIRERIFIVAHSDSEGCVRSAQPNIWQEQSRVEASRWSDAERCNTAVEHASGTGRHEQYTPAEPPAQPGLGGIAPGITSGLGGARGLTWPGWPAPPGQPQHDYEPPRTTDGGKHRRQRLKALGNCVVPAQAYPVLCAIVDAIRAEEETPWEHEEMETRRLLDLSSQKRSTSNGRRSHSCRIGA